MLLSVKSLALTLGAPLFSDLSFSVQEGDVLGLIAANGRGKSSLLRCLSGEMDPTAGEVTRARQATIARAEQDPSDLAATLRETVLRGLADPEGEFWKADILLDELDVPEEFRDQPLEALSGGWQRTALLARAAASEPSVLLLDEPTNHLDLTRIGLLQRWLKGRTVIVASHDRAFLDAVCTRSLFLRASESRLFALPYTPARAALAEADAARSVQAQNDLAKADQLRRQAAKLKNIGINSGSDLLVVKTRQLKERADKIEAAARPAHRETSAGAIRLAPTGSHAKALIAYQDAEIRGDRPLYRTGALWIEPGDRVVILGANGTGKSRLVEATLAAIRKGDPAIKATPSLVLGHSGQGLEQLPPKSTPFDLVMSFRTGDGPARSLLAEVGIRPDMQGKALGLLSGGQKARLAMLLLRLTGPNFYLLDEPTNHLDIEGQEALQTELLKPEAACLLVSHDRAFVRAVGNRFWEIRGKKLVEVDGPEDFFNRHL